MISRLPAERARHSLASVYRTIQITTWIAGTTFLAIVLCADPDHKVLDAAVTVFAHLADMILN